MKTKTLCVFCKQYMKKSTEHHIFPYNFLIHLFPERKDLFDKYNRVVDLCKKCHFRYENDFAFPLKQKISKEYGILMDDEIFNPLVKVFSHARLIYTPLIPIEKKIYIQNEIFTIIFLLIRQKTEGQDLPSFFCKNNLKI